MKWSTPDKAPDLISLNGGKIIAEGDPATPDIFNEIVKATFYIYRADNTLMRYKATTSKYSSITSSYTRYNKGYIWTNNGYIDPRGTFYKVATANNPGNLQPATSLEYSSNNLIFWRTSTQNTYNIMGQVYTPNGSTGFNSTKLVTMTSEDPLSLGLYEPFYIDGYLFWSEQHPQIRGRQYIKGKKVKDNGLDIVSDGDPFVVFSGSMADDTGVVRNCRPGFVSVAKLPDSTYIMVLENNVNVQSGYPYVVQYAYSEDLVTWTTPKTLFAIKDELVNAPYVVANSDGNLCISYHTTQGRTGATDNVGIHNKVFRVHISRAPVTYGMSLSSGKFVEVDTYKNKANEWTGGWGSVYVDPDTLQFCAIYTVGHITDGKSIQDGLYVTSYEQYIDTSTDFDERSWPDWPDITKLNNNNDYEVADGITAQDINIVMDMLLCMRTPPPKCLPATILFTDDLRLEVRSPTGNGFLVSTIKVYSEPSGSGYTIIRDYPFSSGTQVTYVSLEDSQKVPGNTIYVRLQGDTIYASSITSNRLIYPTNGG